MRRFLFSIFLGLICYTTFTNAVVNRICQPFADSTPQNLPFPKLPPTFQAHVEGTLNGRTMKANEYYVQYENKASAILTDASQRTQVINDYNKDLLIMIVGNTCSTAKLSENENAGFFGIHFNGGVETIGTPSEVFHFNDGKFGTRYIGQEVIRGIPVNHWQSCQNWDVVQGNLLLDFYFTVKGYNSSFLSNEFQETLVLMTVKGIDNIDDVQNTFKDVNNIYSYYDFRSIILDYDYAFNIPRGVYCPGIPFSSDILQLNRQFQFNEEIILPNGQVLVSKVYYDYNIRATRVDTQYALNLAPPFNQDPLTIIHDFNSGVAYTYDRYRKNCTRSSIDDDSYDASDVSFSVNNAGNVLGYEIRMRRPHEFFHIEYGNSTTYYYNGKRTVRGIECESFVSNRTDFKLPTIPNLNYSIFEWCFLAKDWVDETSDEAEVGVPIASTIFLPEINVTIHTNIYDFDQSPIPVGIFDISECYGTREKTSFGVSFPYGNPVITEHIFRDLFLKLAEGFFLVPITAALSGYNISPLRLIPPKAIPFEDKFVIFSGIIDEAPPLLQFNKAKNQVRIDLNKILYKQATFSQDNCAYACVNATRLTNDKFECYSFDYCRNSNGRGGTCAFYNASHITDPSFIVQTGGDLCDHYSKTVDRFDALPREYAMKQINNAVLTKNFNLTYIEANNVVVTAFSASEITETFGDVTGTPVGSFGNFGGGFGNFGGSSLNQFTPFQTLAAVFNEEAIALNKSALIRKRSLISVSECARLCDVETSFVCESFTYDYKKLDCAWSNVEGDIETVPVHTSNIYVTALPADSGSTSVWYLRDPIYNYIRYPNTVTQEFDYKPITGVETESQCAKLCDKEPTFICKSFNYCRSLRQCLLSKNHVYVPNKDPGIVPNPVCEHFSKRTINDFEIVPETEITNLNPFSKVLNTSVEICSALCTFEESVLCRSFTYYLNSGECRMYKESLKDIVFLDIKTGYNALSNHYTRTYYTANGQTYQVTANNGKKGKKYSGGTIFGVLLALIIGFIVVGILSGYTYSKYKGKTGAAYEAKLKFVNPSYEKSSISDS